MWGKVDDWVRTIVKGRTLKLRHPGTLRSRRAWDSGVQASSFEEAVTHMVSIDDVLGSVERMSGFWPKIIRDNCNELDHSKSLLSGPQIFLPYEVSSQDKSERTL